MQFNFVICRINNCVGEDNHFAFMQLIFYSVALSIAALAFSLSKSYKLPPCPQSICDPVSVHVIYHVLYIKCDVLRIPLITVISAVNEKKIPLI